jgi:hypothetical protein
MLRAWLNPWGPTTSAENHAVGSVVTRQCAFGSTSCWTGTVSRSSCRGKTHVVTYTDILRDLEPLNEGRDKRDRITYSSLWVHAKRHYDLAGVTAYWRARMHEELMNALGG